MPKFALKFPCFIIMLCLVVALVGTFNVVRMPVDLFPKIDMPVVVVATFYNGMPPSRLRPISPTRLNASLGWRRMLTTANRVRSLA
jgi:Cu/Ag efflux pump CusA